MKNILKIIIFLLVFSIGKVNAENFYEDNYVTGVFATYQKNDFIKAQQMRFIRRYGDNIAAYCLTPEETIYEEEKYTARFSNQSTYLNISKEKYKRISEIAYFGYNYKDHTDIKWYAITQVMLWKEMEPNSDVFYTDKIKGNKIERFTLEEQEIENLIKNYNLLPNINNLDLTVNKKYEINDSNNILNEYEIEKNNLLDIKISNNKLIINPKEKGTFKIKLIRKDGTHSHTTIPYTASKGQDLLVRGSIDRPYKEISINVTGGDLKIKKIDSETLSTESRGEASIVGANYKLYDDDNNLVDTLVINNEGVATINDLEYGNYTLKETKAPTGYNLDSNIYKLNINSNNESLELKEEIIKGKLIINKYLENENILPESNISFKIFDSNNNLVDEITTNKLGQATIELIYGKYKIVQQNTTLGYKKVEDFYITIDSNEDKVINLEDSIIVANLKVIKKDSENKNTISLSETSFKIKDLINNKYLKNNSTDIFKTNNGILRLVITGGKYKLEEIDAPTGYVVGDSIEFTIDENTKLENNTLEIEVYNKKQYGKLNIIKKGKLINNNLILLKNVKFKIYAYEDIITNDNVLHYKKDELINTLTTDINGTVSIDNLLIGKYYIKEESTLDNFIIDKNKYIIDFNNDLNIDVITKEITITNNEKEVIIDKIENNDINKENLNNKKEDNNIQIKKDNNENITTIYPKTSNTDIYINSIICYLSLFGVILIISGIKSEKVRNFFNNHKYIIIYSKKKNRK